MYRNICVSFILLFCMGLSKVYFKETFITEKSINAWTYPVIEPDLGKFIYVGIGKHFVAFRSIQTFETFKQYRLSRNTLPFINKQKILIFQYEVQYPQMYECGGADMKLIRMEDYNAALFNSKTPYAIRFGPDTCGFERKVLLELNINGTVHKWKKTATFPDNNVPQYFTLILRLDDTYEVQVNMTNVGSGRIEDDFTHFEKRFILDLDRNKKPPDWDDRKFILDESDSQPEYWNNDEVPDTTHPLIDDVLLPDNGFQVPKKKNKNNNRKWKPRLLRNLKYNGTWLGRPRSNPFYTNYLHDMGTIGAVAIDIWQPYAQVRFDNILLTDDLEYAKRFAMKNWHRKKRYMLSEITLTQLRMKTTAMRDAMLARSLVDMSYIMSNEDRLDMIKREGGVSQSMDSVRQRYQKNLRRRLQTKEVKMSMYPEQPMWWDLASFETFLGYKVCLSFGYELMLWKHKYQKRVPDMCIVLD